MMGKKAQCVTILSIVLVVCKNPTTTEVGDSTINEPVADKNGLIIKYPNGGESFCIGDSMLVRFGYMEGEDSALAGTDGVIDLRYEHGKKKLLNMAAQLDLINDSVYIWAIPDSIWEVDGDGAFTGKQVPFPVGDGFRLHISDYSDIYKRSDNSDGSFSIKKCK